MDSTPRPFIPDPSEIEQAGQYFRYMAEFVGFTDQDSQAIRDSGLIVEKYLPDIIGRFYTNLLQYPPTRKFFLKKDGSVDQDYLQLRMYHQANFWRRTATGVYDYDYAHFVAYVGKAHTSRGADPKLFIAERYVIGMVGFVQHAITDALIRELSEYDPDLQKRAILAWNKICMVLLEVLARAYGPEREGEVLQESLIAVDPASVFDMSVESYEKGLGLGYKVQFEEVAVAREAEIPEGERKIVDVKGDSIGVFHHKGGWYAIRNVCLHRGGPVATGKLLGDNIVCPWHGYTYDVRTGSLLMDPTAKLQTYPVTIRDGQVWLKVLVPDEEAQSKDVNGAEKDLAVVEPFIPQSGLDLKENEFQVEQLPPGQMKLVRVSGQLVVVYNVDDQFYATQNECTHAGGPLNEGELEGAVVTCPWHYSCFDVRDGSVVCKPAVKKLVTYSVRVEGNIGRVEPVPTEKTSG